MAAVVKEYGSAVLAAVGGVVFLARWDSFAVQTGIDYADDRGLGKRRLLMKELIRQYTGTAIAVVTALVLIALVSEMSVVVEKGIPKSRALCETDTAAFEGYWRSR